MLLTASYAQFKQNHPDIIMTPLDADMPQQSRAADTGTIDIKLYNSLGQALINITKLVSSKSTALDIGKIPNGTYFLHLTQNGETQKSQIIIQH